eukprot:352803-Chlamydomonas_euryale.AAC.7
MSKRGSGIANTNGSSCRIRNAPQPRPPRCSPLRPPGATATTGLRMQAHGAQLVAVVGLCAHALNACTSASGCSRTSRDAATGGGATEPPRRGAALRTAAARRIASRTLRSLYGIGRMHPPRPVAKPPSVACRSSAPCPGGASCQ